jgi:hypothetical protein
MKKELSETIKGKKILPAFLILSIVSLVFSIVNFFVIHKAHALVSEIQSSSCSDMIYAPLPYPWNIFHLIGATVFFLSIFLAFLAIARVLFSPRNKKRRAAKLSIFIGIISLLFNYFLFAINELLHRKTEFIALRTDPVDVVVTIIFIVITYFIYRKKNTGRRWIESIRIILVSLIFTFFIFSFFYTANFSFGYRDTCRSSLSFFQECSIRFNPLIFPVTPLLHLLPVKEYGDQRL